MVPSLAMKAAVKGSRVFFIQKHCMPSRSNTKSMPSLAGMVLRCISPIWRCSGVLATCTEMVLRPSCRRVRGRVVWGWLTAGAGLYCACAVCAGSRVASVAQASKLAVSSRARRCVCGGVCVMVWLLLKRLGGVRVADLAVMQPRIHATALQ